MTNKKFTVIGGSGFVGTNLCRMLATKQREFEIIDLKMSTQFPDKCKIGDVRNLSALSATITGDVVINLAAVHRDDIQNKQEYYDTNVKGAENVAKICTQKGINRIIFTSSVAVYGFAEPGTDEKGEINPFNEYGRSKYKAEEKLRIWQSEGDNELIIIRPTVIFGEGNRGNVYSLMKQIASGRFVMIGAGKNKKSMAYIGNVIAFIEHCLNNNTRYAVYNYVDTPDLDMNTLVQLVQKTLNCKNILQIRIPYSLGLIIGKIADYISRITGKKLPLSSIRVRKFCSSTAFGTSKDKLEGFKAPFTLQEGIKRTLQSEFLSSEKNKEVFYTE